MQVTGVTREILLATMPHRDNLSPDAVIKYLIHLAVDSAICDIISACNLCDSVYKPLSVATQQSSEPSSLHCVNVEPFHNTFVF